MVIFSKLHMKGTFHTKVMLWLFPISCFIVMIILTVTLANTIQLKEQNFISDTTQEVADMVQRTLNHNLETKILFLKELALQWQIQEGIPYEEFIQVGSLLAHDLDDLSTLEWIGPDYTIHWVTPLKGNENVIGLNILFDETRRQALEHAIESKQPTITTPIQLKQGYSAIIIYFPLFKNNQFDGFIAGILKVDEFVKIAIVEWDSHYFNIELNENNGQAIFGFIDRKIIDQSRMYSRPISILDKTWNVNVFPKKKFIDIHSTNLSDVIFAMGTGMAFMFTIIVYSFIRRLQTNEKILENERRLQSFIQMVPASIAMLDKKLCYISASCRWQEYFMKSHETLIGKKFKDHFIFDLSQHSHIEECMQAALKGQSSHVRDDVFTNKKGKHIWLRYEIFPWIGFNNKIQGIVVSMENITEQKEVEIIKNDFISTVSHELRTPLTSVFGAISILQHKLKDRLVEKEHNLMRISFANCQRVIALVNDILDINKIEAGKMEYSFEVIDICSLVETIVAQNQTYAETYSIAFTVNFERQPIFCNLDINRFTQALVNLLSNAAKFSPKHSSVAVSVFMNDLQHVNIAVRDYGPGIPLSFRQSIFDKFAQADASATKSTDGTGLGLHITQAIIEAFSGKVFFESILDEGTTFYLQIPIAQGQLLSNVFPVD